MRKETLRVSGLIFSDCIGNGFLHQPEGSLLTLRRGCKCSAFADLLNPLRGRRKETLRVSDLMALRRPGGTGDTSSGRRCPPCGSPLAGEHNPDRSSRHSSLTVQPTVLARTLLRQPTPCDEFRLHRNSSVCSADATQTAIETRMKWMVDLERLLTEV